MRALIATRYGGVDHLRIEQIPDPLPEAGEVLIKTEAASLNALDWRIAYGEPWFIRIYTGMWKPHKVPVMGADVAGIVVATGPGVTRVQVGDRVFGEIGIKGQGGISEFAVCSEKNIAKVPTNLDLNEASCLGVAGLTALQGLQTHAMVGPGEHVAITGASGGVGHLAVQVAKALGAEVTAITSTPHMEMVAALGADHVIDRTQGEWLDNGPFDVILESACYRPLRDYVPALSDEGRFIMVGGSSGAMLQALARGKRIFGKDRFKDFTAEPTPDDLDALAAMAARGLLRPSVDSVVSMEEAPVAIQRLKEGNVAGKIVVSTV